MDFPARKIYPTRASRTLAFPRAEIEIWLHGFNGGDGRVDMGIHLTLGPAVGDPVVMLGAAILGTSVHFFQNIGLQLAQGKLGIPAVDVYDYGIDLVGHLSLHIPTLEGVRGKVVQSLEC